TLQELELSTLQHLDLSHNTFLFTPALTTLNMRYSYINIYEYDLTCDFYKTWLWFEEKNITPHLANHPDPVVITTSGIVLNSFLMFVSLWNSDMRTKHNSFTGTLYTSTGNWGWLHVERSEKGFYLPNFTLRILVAWSVIDKEDVLVNTDIEMCCLRTIVKHLKDNVVVPLKYEIQWRNQVSVQ
ncbi:hypothetical protein L9F63_014047, partial [Diploptera punctata]